MRAGLEVAEEVLLPPGGTEGGGQDTLRWATAGVRVLVDDTNGRNDGKGLESHVFVPKVKKKNQSMTLKKFMNF